MTNNAEPIFVTGATGFIGTRLVQSLVQRGERVRALSRRVFHLAAYAKVWARDPSTYISINIEGMRNVFAAAQRHSVERVVLTSTVMTLGPPPTGVVADKKTPRTSDRYLTEYEETKTIAEAEALERAANGFPVVVVNPTRVFGPGI